MLDADQRSPPDGPSPSAEPSLVDSLVRVVEAGQRIVLDRIDLARFDVSHAATRLLSAAALLGVGTMLMTGAWFLLMGGAVAWLQPQLSLPLSFVVAAVLTVAVGGAALAVGASRMREEATGAGERDETNGSSVAATGSNHGGAVE
jgi:hypothetical protein